MFTYLFQVVDYAIARRIVDLHRLLDENIERVYTPDEIQRYLTFARQFKPMVNFILNIKSRYMYTYS